MTGTVFCWNPRRPVVPGPLGHRIPLHRRLNNFGDLIGPLVVRRMLDKAALDGPPRVDLFTVGSVLHFAKAGAVIWGSGVNGKVREAVPQGLDLDVRAVRGPRTRAYLDERGIPCPAVYGDPALLLPRVLPELREWHASPRHDLTVVPNLHDWVAYRGHPDVLNPRAPLFACLKRIAQSRLIVGSSLHGIIVAESLGIPARLVVPGVESLLKYEDYYFGTGRSSVSPAVDARGAVALGGEPPLAWDAEPLQDSFPFDLWSPTVSDRV